MPSKRVLVLFESGRGGAAALDVARQLAEGEEAAVTVVGLVPRAMSGARCGNSALDYNGALVDAVASDLDQARDRLGEAGRGASYQLLIDGEDPPLDAFAAAGAFDLVLLPARRRPLRSASHPAAAGLRRAASRAEIRIVDPRAHQTAQA